MKFLTTNNQASSSSYEDARAIEDKIQNFGYAKRKEVYELLELMEAEYMELQQETTEWLATTKSLRMDKLAVILRLSQYGEALYHMQSMYSKINPLGCNKPS
tara:strand:+ start:32 stop:337 length:306 start_codon:yes stop_codon:yes gene_type:complete